MGDLAAPQQKRFSMNYQDFIGGQQSEVTPKDKRFSMNMQDFLRQQRRQGDGRMAKKRFTIVRDLDTLAVPVSGYWDLAPQQSDQGGVIQSKFTLQNLYSIFESFEDNAA